MWGKGCRGEGEGSCVCVCVCGRGSTGVSYRAGEDAEEAGGEAAEGGGAVAQGHHHRQHLPQNGILMLIFNDI